MTTGADNCCLLLENHKQTPTHGPTARRETYCRQAALKLITYLHSKGYQSSGMLIHWKNSYVPRSKQRTCVAVNRPIKLKNSL
jgi:hypothetical protein